MITTAIYYIILVFQNYELEHAKAARSSPAAESYSVNVSIAICIPSLKAYLKMASSA